MKSLNKISNVKHKVLEGPLGSITSNGDIKVLNNNKLIKLNKTVRIITISTNNEYQRPNFFNDSFVILNNI